MQTRSGRPPLPPDMQKRAQRQRRMTAGGGKAAAGGPVLLPVAAAVRDASASTDEQRQQEQQPPQQQQQQQRQQQGQPAEEQPPEQPPQQDHSRAWQEWVCPSHPDVWAFCIEKFPAAWLELMASVHPATAFPGHSADNLPPALKDAAALASSLQAMRQPVLRPAADGGVPAAAGGVPAAAAAAAAAEEEEEEEWEDWDDGVLSSGADCCYLDSIGDGGCSCEACRVERRAARGSSRRAPGKKVSWSGAIGIADPVRRNLFPVLAQAGGPPKRQRTEG